MAITRIRGGQIQDRTLDGIKLKTAVIMDEHVASNAAIAETKLAIDWHAHKEILQDKKILDYVQINSQVVNGLDSLDVTLLLGAGTTAALSTGSVEGIITDAPKNQVIVRDVVTGDPILNADSNEVYGRVVYTAEVPEVPESALGAGDGTPAIPAKYEIKFFGLNATDVETAFTMPGTQSVKMQYLRRFNLATVDEMFAANEKFVDGSADTNARLDLQQLAKDLYGNSWSFEHDGAANLGRSLVDEIVAQTSGTGANISVRASVIIDEVIAARGAFANLKDRLDGSDTSLNSVVSEVTTARGGKASLTVRLVDIETKNTDQDTAIATEITDRTAADTAIRSDIASTATGKGAGLVGVDSTKGLTGATVEAVLENINSRTSTLENGGGAEVTATHHRDAATTNGLFPVADFADIEARLVDIESKTDEAKKALETADTAEATARTDADNLIKSDLASNATGKGSSLVGVEDAGNKFTATTVEGVLAEIDTALDAEVTRATAAEGTLTTDLATEITNRTNADTAIRNDIASTDAGKGAGLVGVDITKGLTGTTVEAVLENINSRTVSLESGGGAEVSATHSREVNSANGTFVAKTGAQEFASLEDRILDIETVVDAAKKALETADTAEATARADADSLIKSDLASTVNAKGASLVGIEDAAGKITAATVEGALVELEGRISTEVSNRTAADTAEATARADADTAIRTDLASNVTGKGASLIGIEDSAGTFTATNMEAALTELYTKVVTDNGAQDTRINNLSGSNHVHKKYIENVTVQKSVMNMPVNEYFKNDGTLNVYINGILQANGINFTEVYDGSSRGISIDFGSDPILVGDVVVLTYVVAQSV